MSRPDCALCLDYDYADEPRDAEAMIVAKGEPAPGFEPVPTCWRHAEEVIALNDQEGWPAEHHAIPLD